VAQLKNRLRDALLGLAIERNGIKSKTKQKEKRQNVLPFLPFSSSSPIANGEKLRRRS